MAAKEEVKEAIDVSNLNDNFNEIVLFNDDVNTLTTSLKLWWPLVTTVMNKPSNVQFLSITKGNAPSKQVPTTI